MLAGDGFFGQRNTTLLPSAQDFLRDFRGGFGNIFSVDGKKDPKTDNKKGTYGGLTRQDLLDIQDAGFKQQNELLKKSMILDAGKAIGQGLMAGPQAYVQNVLPQMFAGNAAILSAGASGNRSLAMAYGQPIQSLRKSFFV